MTSGLVIWLASGRVRARISKLVPIGLEYLISDFVAESVDDLVLQMRVMAEQIAPKLVG